MIKKFYNWIKDKKLIKIGVGILLVLIGAIGLLIPFLSGTPALLTGIFILVPNKSLSKFVFRHEKVIDIMIALTLVTILIPAALIGFGLISLGQIGNYIVNIAQFKFW